MMGIGIRQMALVLAATVMTPALAQSADWYETEIPEAELHRAQGIAIGSDGQIYEARSNDKGYVLVSKDQKHIFLSGPDGWTGTLYRGHDVFYLGKSCDAINEHPRGPIKGSWTNDSTGLNLAFTPEGASVPLMSWRFWDDAISSDHDC